MTDATSGQMVTVYLIHRYEQARALLRNALQTVPEVRIVGESGDAAAGVEEAAGAASAILFLGTTSSLPTDLAALARYRALVPSGAVVLVVPTLDSGMDLVRREARQAGASDILGLPFTPEDVRALIDRLAPRRGDAPKRGRVLTLFSGTSGQGVSTIATALAMSLRKGSEDSVALVDLDARSASMSSLLQLPPSSSAAEVKSWLPLDAGAVRAAMIRHPSGVYMFPQLPSEQNHPLVPGARIDDVLSALATSFDTIVVDASSAMDGRAIAALQRADDALLVVEPDERSLLAARRSLDQLRELGSPRWRTAIQVVVNREQGRPGESRALVERVLGTPASFAVASDVALQRFVDQYALRERGILWSGPIPSDIAQIADAVRGLGAPELRTMRAPEDSPSVLLEPADSGSGAWTVESGGSSSYSSGAPSAPAPAPPVKARGSAPDRASQKPDESKSGAQDVIVWFGTNRKPLEPKEKKKGYSSRRDDTVHYGQCRVHIPESHKIASVGSSWWDRVRSGKDDRLKLTKIEELLKDAFWSQIAERLKPLAVGDRHAVVFVHGYNVSFEGAALRAAQMAADLPVKGAMAFFSWPSQGTLAGYPADEATIEASEDLIADFLVDFARKSGANAVHVIAHSMGNRGVLRAVNRIAADAQRRSGIAFGQFVLAAADVDVDTFRRLAAAYHEIAARTTLYVSARDRAVEASRWLHAFQRAGLEPPTTVVPGIDTISVTNVDMTLLGHGYVADARAVLSDMHDLIFNGSPPERRFGLREEHTQNGDRYWRIGA